jgi:16S rRNA (adenine1518-N6/adenine1519-N6)-dimethyltransferase
MLQRKWRTAVALPGSKAYGRLSVMLQCYHIEAVLEVPPQAQPAAEGGFHRRAHAPLNSAGEQAPALLSELVTVAFSQRRKLLRHTLGRWLEARGVNSDFDLQRRAEEVPVAQYVELALHAASP